LSRLFLACALALVTMTGCSSGSPGSAEPVATSTTTGPHLPAAAKPATSSGALAFAVHYIGTLNYARRTGDVSGLFPLEDRECQTCQALRHSISQVYDYAGTITGGTWKVDSLGAAEEPDAWSIDGKINITRQRIDGTPTNDGVTAAKYVAITGSLVRRNGTWKVLSWTRGV